MRMERVRSVYGSGLLVTLVVSGLTAGCSDDSGKSPIDGGKTDAPSGVEVAANLDTGVPDAPAASGPEVAKADGPANAIDAPVADTSISGGLDGQAVDGLGVDGGNPLVARGKYLVEHVIGCADCHTAKTASGAPDMTKFMAGNATFVKLPNGDALPSRNLTPDKATGLGNFTAAQIKRMVMDGIVPGADGGTMALNPIMPYYVFHNLAADDADAIVAYLQALPAVNNPLPDRSASFDVPAPANYLDPTTIPTPADAYPQKASALRGRYLATQSGLCIECHTEHNPPGNPDVLNSSKFFQGGEDFSAFFAGTLNIHPVSANLTSDPTTGLGDWTADQIVTVLLQGKDDHGDGICPPMPAGPDGPYGGLTQQDALDIANFIKSLPPAVNDVPDMCSWPPTPALDGGGVDGAELDASSVDLASHG
jgi:mono/diheme cytochrome c family protein